MRSRMVVHGRASAGADGSQPAGPRSGRDRSVGAAVQAGLRSLRPLSRRQEEGAGGPQPRRTATSPVRSVNRMWTGVPSAVTRVRA
ncbi:hypothetical protein GCM10018793_60890 [Streptomyces sulfonofaciens]|uniref:Uncharacterized protein n=1 Tax=Streptomyces sulfonofaciens TaxID=68272 RepID=A0A919L7N1_9ACTN|nr:hypothetical protein GCM10018793_60890 [Streptomyces sulfonofaciens]